jgi:hypothetical protein
METRGYRIRGERATGDGAHEVGSERDSTSRGALVRTYRPRGNRQSREEGSPPEGASRPLPWRRIRPSVRRIRPLLFPIRPCPCPIRPNLVFVIDGCTAFVRMLSQRCQRLLDFVTPIATQKERQ